MRILPTIESSRSSNNPVPIREGPGLTTPPPRVAVLLEAEYDVFMIHCILTGKAASRFSTVTAARV
jgi:hypothetical protein